MQQKQTADYIVEDILYDGRRSIDGRRYRLQAHKAKRELRKFRFAS